MMLFSITTGIILTLQILPCLAQNRTTEGDEATIKDPQIECAPYSYPPLVEQRASFPTSWKPAQILPGDAAAQAQWQSISSNVPDIPPKATGSGGSGYGADDPDCWWTQTGCVTPKLPGLPPDVASVPEPYTLGYGFDDGPNCSHNAFYDYLASKNQKATMFFIGSNVLDWPLEAQRALTDGHEICVHTWSHTAMTSLSSDSAFAELYYCTYFLSRENIQIIKLVVGVTPTCWRPPYGDADDRIRAIANAMGLRTIMWIDDTNDWMVGEGMATKAQIDANYQGVIDQVTNGTFSSVGAIILAHEIDNSTMQEAIDFYDRLRAAFKYIVPIAVALNKTQPYVETNYVMPTFEQYINNVSTVARTGEEPPPAVDGPTQPEPEASEHSAAPVGRRLASTLSVISPIVLCLLIC